MPHTGVRYRPRRSGGKSMKNSRDDKTGGGVQTKRAFIRWITPYLRLYPGGGSIATNCCKQPYESRKKRRVHATPGTRAPPAAGLLAATWLISGAVTSRARARGPPRPRSLPRHTLLLPACSHNTLRSVQSSALRSPAPQLHKKHGDRSRRTINYVPSPEREDLYKSTDIAFYP